MSKQADTTLIGTFVVGAIVLLTVSIMLFGGDAFFNPRERVVMYFSGTVEGLNVGAPVNVRGVQVGTVTSINLEFNTQTGDIRIPVIAEINAGAVNQARLLQTDDPLKAIIEQLGLRAQLQLQSYLTSQLFIQLDYHPNTPVNYYGDGSMIEIPTIPMPIEKIDKILNEISIEQMMSDVSSSLSAINRLVNSEEIPDTISNMNETLANLNTVSTEVRKEFLPLVKDVRATISEARITLENMRQTLENLAAVTSEDSDYMQDLKQTIRNVSDAAETVSDLQNLPQMQKLDSALEEITIAARRIGSFEDSPQMVNLNKAMEELADAARSVREVADAIERQPEILLRGRRGDE